MEGNLNRLILLKLYLGTTRYPFNSITLGYLYFSALSFLSFQRQSTFLQKSFQVHYAPTVNTQTIRGSNSKPTIFDARHARKRSSQMVVGSKLSLLFIMEGTLLYFSVAVAVAVAVAASSHFYSSSSRIVARFVPRSPVQQFQKSEMVQSFSSSLFRFLLCLLSYKLAK